MSLQYILFDLDGTLTDPMLGITNSIMYALHQMGEEVKEREAYKVFIGPPLHASFMNYCHLDDDRAQVAVDTYREYFSVTGLFENEVYEGMEAFLEKLTHAGYQLALATSKPEIYAVKIMEHFGLAKYFTHLCGSDITSKSESKADVIYKAMSLFDDANPDHYLMIGDRLHDAQGAKTHGISTIGVTYGYGSREELEAAGCLAVVDGLDELFDVITK